MRIFVLRKRLKDIFREYLLYIIVAALIGLVMRLFIIEVYKVPSESMVPTLLPGDHIAVLKFFKKPRRGDIVVFKKEGDPSSFVKRVMAVPKDVIEIKQGNIYINTLPLRTRPLTETKIYSLVEPGTSVYKEYISDKYHLIARSNTYVTDYFTYKMDDGYFVMGDNRTNSVDSRRWGEIKSSDILGKVVYIWFSVEPGTKKIRWDRIGRIHEVEVSDNR